MYPTNSQSQDSINYQRIAEAIDYIKVNFKSQPDLNDVAEKLNLSPFHFQRLFSEWAGVSPKKFLQYLSLDYAKSLLKEQQATLFDAAMKTGLSGTSRLHDLFLTIEGMTPGEYKNGGAQLYINYSFADSLFGKIIIASTHKGICYLAFVEVEEEAFAMLLKAFPNAQYQKHEQTMHKKAIQLFNKDCSDAAEVKLHLKGSPFQLKVWEALLKIPAGKLATYGTIAAGLNNPKACRAVGSAIGKNPIAFIIPCHRVIQSTGIIGGYHWGTTRKTAIIGWEAAKTLGQ
ncbi:AraC family transcriptional regulator of adaptative response/methylated-DNA-[protein]-cysteine methyltransferase [Pedobacter sp. CG_S7]|uniref:methylated-DNA--[protein]-cysteine S-methyltransferase n=1 Tax=Pedobacter sp. CG_S7 TaxID=3143930 RepID=UPI003398296E